ncbi:MAG TPA: glycine cleavage T C-terminal barrel domain-containing protein [Pyrinomonadaceae bacterium]|nr:glycine cleavage T C-terminal barrel domain-containing protein [Pyrinomonadaceae bacterium]
MLSETDLQKYELIRAGRAGFYEQKRGLIAVWGKEAAQFLDGLITNSVKELKDGEQMLAAFPNVQGRLLAVVRVRRDGGRFLFETEETTHEAVFQNLFRFTFAGDFFAEDISDGFSYFEIFGPKEDVYHPGVGERFAGGVAFELPYGAGYFIADALAGNFHDFLTMKDQNDCQEVDGELYEVLRIESGIPKYGVDMDATTVVPEVGLEGLISYKKGCYIGQEIIARIHFRGHVAKQLTGLILNPPPDGVAEGRLGSLVGTDLTSSDGNPAGKITSATYSPHLQKVVALASVRYAYLAGDTVLHAGDVEAVVTPLPFI